MGDEREPLLGGMSTSYGGQRVDVMPGGQHMVREKSVMSISSVTSEVTPASVNIPGGQDESVSVVMLVTEYKCT